MKTNETKKHRSITFINISPFFPPRFSYFEGINHHRSNPWKKGTHTPVESRYTPLSKFNRLEKRRRVRELQFDRWISRWPHNARLADKKERRLAERPTSYGLNPSVLTTPCLVCTPVIFNDLRAVEK